MSECPPPPTPPQWWEAFPLALNIPQPGPFGGVPLNVTPNDIFETIGYIPTRTTAYVFDGGSPSSDYTNGPAFDCGGVT